jgi:dCMP deaminase
VAERPGWHAYFMAMAELAASRGTCPRRRVGAVLARGERVIATGYNGSLRGQPHCTDVGCLLVDGHCRRTVHAEMNALLQCALHGSSSLGTICYTTSFPCLDCAKALAQAGVVRVIYRDAYPGPEPDPLTRELLQAAGVVVEALGEAGP